MKVLNLCLVASIFFSNAVLSQEFVSPTAPTQAGKAPGMKVKLLDSLGARKNYVIVFSSGDEVKSGLTSFAQQYNISTAHYTAVGDITAGKMGFYDYGRKMFKVISIDTSEVVSFIGNITMYDGKPAVHVHASFAGSDGSVKGGHLLEITVGPTFEVFVTVEPTAVYKKLDTLFDAAVIDPSLNK